MTGRPRLSHVATLAGRIGWQNLRADDFTEEGPYLVTGMHFRDGDVDWKACYHVDEERWSMAPEIQLRPHDVLFTKDGSIGKTAYINSLPEKATLNSHLLVVRPKRSDFVPRFLYWVLTSELMADYIEVEKRGTTFHGISQESMERFRLPLPPLAEQRAIADYLDAETARIDALIAKKKRLIHLLEERWQTVVSDYVWGSTVSRTRLKYLAGLPTSGNRDHGSFTDDDSGVPCLRGLNVRPARLDLTNLRFISDEDHAQQLQTQLDVGDIVIVRSGLAGAAVRIPSELQPCNCVDLVVVRRSALLDPIFVEYVINSREAQEQVARNSTGALLTHFNAIDAGNLSVPDLPLGRQKAIAEELGHEQQIQSSVVAALAKQLELLGEHRQALVTAAVAGDITTAGVA